MNFAHIDQKRDWICRTKTLPLFFNPPIFLYKKHEHHHHANLFWCKIRSINKTFICTLRGGSSPVLIVAELNDGANVALSIKQGSAEVSRTRVKTRVNFFAFRLSYDFAVEEDSEAKSLMFVLLEAGRLYGDILVDLLVSLVYPDGSDLRLKVCVITFLINSYFSLIKRREDLIIWNFKRLVQVVCTPIIRSFPFLVVRLIASRTIITNSKIVSKIFFLLCTLNYSSG
jgi:hypothetical protein